MSTFSLTRGSEAALGMLASQAGSETLLLTQPARELRAELSIEPFTSDSGDHLLAVLFMREQRHSMTLQRNDGANAQHLADWIEAVANGTLDTAEAIPQRTAPAPLRPCTKCNGPAIAYDYADRRQTEPGPTRFVNGVKCRHGDCQKTEMHETEAAAASAWNAIQLEQLADSSDLDAATAAFNAAAHELNAAADTFEIDGIKVRKNEVGDWEYLSEGNQGELVAWNYCADIFGPFGGSGIEMLLDAYAQLLGERQAANTQDGWQLVPMEPTQAMREAFHAATERYEDGYGESPDSQWHAMLRAALATSPTA
ncbi:hypothetical protein [Stutzerimonas stutzeri]|uniref:hypothetical protein n=1 Tax=Stutzerimonas stutzeri TaxID=316 RepID=UPI0007757467|nr:hypothetical protein [Stutzerimonas stutzeri]KXO81126.1 hypothetical protein AYK87_13250 [Stutzerimonas stutzeri]